MFKIILECEDVPKDEGRQAATDITNEFSALRTWHEKAICTWTGSTLILEVENDFDENGLATIDEFSDLISAYVTQAFDGDILIRSVTKI